MTRPKLLNGDVRQTLRELESESVHCVVTSPPYWGLRDYGTTGQVWGGDEDCEHTWDDIQRFHPTRGKRDGDGKYVDPKWVAKGGRKAEVTSNFCTKCNAWKGELGSEPTLELFVEHLCDVFDEIWRVLRKDGTVWLNLGDGYAGGGRAGNNPEYKAKHTNFGKVQDMSTYTGPSEIPEGLKPKDLIGVPWRVALALQSKGWWLRNDIIWSKPNPMPEPVKDRLTKSHEYIFLLTKSKRYYYDHEAIKEPYTDSSIQRINQASFDKQTGGDKDYGKVSVQTKNTNSIRGTLEKFKENLGGGRNRRTVWEVVTKPYPGAHFATFPEEIPETCIKAGTSKAGCCASCGAPIERVIEKGEKISLEDYKGEGKKDYASALAENPSDVKRRTLESMRQVIYKGWEASCKCNAEKVPCVVLDPFAGSGTTCAVASRLGRDSIGIELNEEYLKLARKRCKIESESLFKYV